MKRKKIIITFCKKCKGHKDHSLKIWKRKKASELKKGQRRFRRVSQGSGGFPRPKPSGSKPTKRINFSYTCQKCKVIHHKIGIKAKKVELI